MKVSVLKYSHLIDLLFNFGIEHTIDGVSPMLALSLLTLVKNGFLSHNSTFKIF